MRRLVVLFAAVVSLAGATGCVAHTAPPPPANPGQAQMGEWNANHPEAAGELCVWVRNHPDAAHRFFEWGGHHPAKAQEFVTWTLTHPNRGIDGFVSEHPGWGNFDFMTETHHPAANAFMGWARRHPQAAEALTNHPRGLVWAGNHLGC